MMNLEELMLRLCIFFCFTNASASRTRFWSEDPVNKPFSLCKAVTLFDIKDWPTVTLYHLILSHSKCVLIVLVSVTALRIEVIWLHIFCLCEGSCCHHRTVNFEYTSWLLISICVATNFWWRRCRLIQKSRRAGSVYCMAPDARCCGGGRLVLWIVCARRSKLKFGAGWEHNFSVSWKQPHKKFCVSFLSQRFLTSHVC